MSRRRTTQLVIAGLLMAVIGAVLLWRGASLGPTYLTVVGILVLLAGLICLRVVSWSLRVRAMTRAGLAMAQPDRPDQPDQRHGSAD